MKDLKTKIIDKSFNFEDDDGTFKSSTIFLKDLFEIPEIKQLLIHTVVVPKGTFLYPYKHQLKSIDQLNQTQASLSQQLQILRHFANKLGLYDASDYLKEK